MRTSSLTPGCRRGSCVELFGGRGVQSTRDLKGKTVAVTELRSDQHIFTSMFVAHVGLYDLEQGVPMPDDLMEQLRAVVERAGVTFLLAA